MVTHRVKKVEPGDQVEGARATSILSSLLTSLPSFLYFCTGIASDAVKRERFRVELILFHSSLGFPFQLNPTVNTFQRKYVNEVKKCEEMERILGKRLLVFANAVHLLLNKLRSSPGEVLAYPE